MEILQNTLSEFHIPKSTPSLAITLTLMLTLVTNWPLQSPISWCNVIRGIYHLEFDMSPQICPVHKQLS